MELVPTWKGENMLNKEECQKACLYLLKHCYETDAPALENGEEEIGRASCRERV